MCGSRSKVLIAVYNRYSASSLVRHFCYSFYSNYGRFAWFMTHYSADLPEITTQDYYT